MRITKLICVLGLGLLSAGCAMIEYPVINTVVATGRVVDEAKTRFHTCLQADKAWMEARRACPGEKFSKDYAKGFKRGYVETIARNGNGLPPTMPPYCYRSWHFETPAGHQAIDDWFFGYRHGAAVATETGNRDWVILPLSVPGRDKAPAVALGTGDVAPSGAEEYAPPTTLPMPREKSLPAASTSIAPRPGVPGRGTPTQLPLLTPTKAVPALQVPAR